MGSVGPASQGVYFYQQPCWTATAVTFQIVNGCSDPNECRAFCVGFSLRR